MPKITVIMPSLNVAPYIRQCMDSILGQTLEEIEVIAVDGGSSDGTWEILEKYAVDDKRLTLVKSEIKSYGHQVNIGLKRARGEYIGIVETDDRIAEDMFGSLYEIAKDMNLDFVKGRGMFFVDLKNGACWEKPIWMPVSEELAGKVISPCEMPEILEYDVFLWNGIYHRDFLRNIYFNESPGAAFQDQGFLFQTISAAKRAVYIDKIVYYYRQDNSNSSVVNEKGFHYLVNEYAYMERFLEGKEKSWTRMYYLRMLKQCFGRYRSMVAKGSFWENAIADIGIIKRRIETALRKGLLCEDIVPVKDIELLKLLIEEEGERKVFYYLVEKFKLQSEPYGNLAKKTQNKNIVVFGCGTVGKFVHALFANKEGNKVAAFCDNNVDLWGKNIQGIQVVSPQEAVQKYPKAAFIITGIKEPDGMRKQIEQLVGKETDIYEYVPDIEMRLFLI